MSVLSILTVLRLSLYRTCMMCSIVLWGVKFGKHWLMTVICISGIARGNPWETSAHDCFMSIDSVPHCDISSDDRED